MKHSSARRVALTGVLFALAIVLSVLESLLAGFFPLPPGVKLGLANIVVMYALLYLSPYQALLLTMLKAGFSFLTRGGTYGLFSLAGGLLAFAVMALLFSKTRCSLLLISVAGSLSHNLGQFIIVLLLFGKAAAAYLPVLLLSGIGMGVLTSLSLRILLPALQKTGISPHHPPPPDD